jgi:hypothetical protein
MEASLLKRIAGKTISRRPNSVDEPKKLLEWIL